MLLISKQLSCYEIDNKIVNAFFINYVHRYPLTLEEFYQKRLPGTFDETKAGKRMKLAVPETWETQVSLKGNNAKTWEDLIGNECMIA